MWFYKYSAPTALPAPESDYPLREAVQRRRRGISVDPEAQEIKAPAGRHILNISITYCSSMFYALFKRHSGLTRFPFPYIPKAQIIAVGLPRCQLQAWFGFGAARWEADRTTAHPEKSIGGADYLTESTV